MGPGRDTCAISDQNYFATVTDQIEGRWESAL